MTEKINTSEAPTTLRQRIEALAAEWEADDPETWDVHPTGVSAAYAAQFSIVTSLRTALAAVDGGQRYDPWAPPTPSAEGREALCEAVVSDIVRVLADHGHRITQDEGEDGLGAALFGVIESALAARQPAPVDVETTTEWAVEAKTLLDGPWDRIFPMPESEAREQIRRAKINAERRGVDPWERLVSRDVTVTLWREVTE